MKKHKTDYSKKMSILIITYNRYQKLLRLLRYIDFIGMPYKTYILDSSSDEMNIDRKEFNDLLKKHNIDYVKFDSKINPTIKISNGLDKVNTDYVLVWGDDDMIVVNHLEKCINFLDRNPDYSIVHGENAAFGVSKIIGKPSIGCNRYPQKSIEFDSASERLIDHLKEYTTTCYSVHRTRDMQKNYRLSAELGFGYEFGEIFPSFLSLIQGKTKLLDGLFYLREAHSEQNTWSPRTNKDIFDVFMGKDYRDNYIKMKTALITALVEKEGITPKRAAGVIKTSYWGLIMSQLHNCRNYGIVEIDDFACDEETAIKLWKELKYAGYICTSGDITPKVSLLKKPSDIVFRKNIGIDKDMVFKILKEADFHAYYRVPYKRSLDWIKSENILAMIVRKIYLAIKCVFEYLFPDKKMSTFAMLSPFSPYHKDFMPIYDIVLNNIVRDK